MSKNIPEYTLEREHALELVTKIKDFWHSRGQTEVEVWLETIPIYNRATQKKVATRFEINSNIFQSVSSLESGNVI